REKTPTRATKNLTCNNSRAKGRNFVNDICYTVLRADNAEAEHGVAMMNDARRARAENSLARDADQSARHVRTPTRRSTSHDQRSRMRDLALAGRRQRAKQREKEHEREHRAELREQRRVEKEPAAAQTNLEKEREHYRATLAAIEAQGDEDSMAKIEERLADV